MFTFRKPKVVEPESEATVIYSKYVQGRSINDIADEHSMEARDVLEIIQATTN